MASRSRKSTRFWTTLVALSILPTLPAQAATIMINNGLAPPTSANVINHTTFIGDDVYVRNQFCPPAWPSGSPNDPCAAPGSATTVAIEAGAQVFNLDLLDTSSLELRGVVGDDLQVFDSSTTVIEGVSAFIGSSLQTRDTAFVHIRNGNLNPANLFIMEQSNVLVTGGRLNAAKDLRVQQTARATISGTAFQVDGTPVPLGFVAATSGALTGTLSDGTALSVVITRDSTAEILLIPEPGTGTLLLAGLLMLWNRSAHRPTRRCSRTPVA